MRILIFCLILFGSCTSKNSLSPQLKPNLQVYISYVELYKGQIIVNDSILVGGGYFKESKNFDPLKDRIYKNLLVGDSLITDQNPNEYIIRVRDNKRVKFWEYSKIKHK